jgi:PBP1b-binding outer membrane lipoprotein LpoB
MKKLSLVVIVVMALALTLIGCAKYPETPEEVVKTCYHALVNSDYEGYTSFISADSQGLVTSKGFKEEFEEQSSSSWEAQHFKELEITNTEIENDTAQVELIVSYDQQSSRYPDGIDPKTLYLVREQGQWKIVLK